MPLISAALIITTVFLTSFVSGIFGMAGGLILMGVLVALVGVAQAMIVHGIIQMFANGYRAYRLRSYIIWPVFGFYCLGAVAGIGLLIFVSWTPDRRMVYLMLGLVPLLLWLPKDFLKLNIERPAQSILAGVCVQALNTLVGVAGPLLDIFFVRSSMGRHQIVATKSVAQSLSHLVKASFWSLPVITQAGWGAMPPLWLFIIALPVSMFGTQLGGLVLQRMTDQGFRRWIRGLVTIVGSIFLLRAAGLY